MINDNRRGLKEVRVLKSELIERIGQNMQMHAAEFETALAGYWAKVEMEISQAYEGLNTNDLKVGLKHASKAHHLPKPKSHIPEYESALAMLDASQDDQLILQAEDFECYWLDKWRWKEGFSSTNAMYG